MNKNRCLEVAASLGDRITRQALWDGAHCTWQVRALDTGADSGGGTRLEAAGPSLYQGSAGIAWFLGELHHVTEDGSSARAAEGGIRQAIAAAADLPVGQDAFYSGRVGIAYVAARLGRLLYRPDLREQALELLLTLEDPQQLKAGLDGGLDVIAGAAGIIPALLELRHDLGDERLLTIACELGDRLLIRAHREPAGWSWDTVGPVAVRHLTGLGHGAAGFALALLELACATGRDEYRFAAEMAFLYERQHFQKQISNWPDLRHKDLSDLIFFGAPNAVREANEAGTIPPYQTLCMTAWCHGSPGIGLSRLRAYELTGHDLYRREAEDALVSTLRSLNHRDDDNYSLCHGHAGNAELPLHAAEVLANRSLREACLARAEIGWQRHQQAPVPWPCGTADRGPDPSLMLGEAGIGFFYLRLSSPQTPSPLLRRPPLMENACLAENPAVGNDGFGDMAREAAREYFGQTLDLFAVLGHPVESFDWCANSESPLRRSPAEMTYRELRRVVESTWSPRRELLVDAFRRERTGYELACEASDFSVEYLSRLRRPAVDDVPWSQALLGRCDNDNVVTQQWDWQSWLATSDGQSSRPSDLPEAAEVTTVIQRHRGRPVMRELSPFAALLLSALDDPCTLAQLAQRVGQQIDGADQHPARLVAMVEQQARELYRGGFIDWVDSREKRAVG